MLLRNFLGTALVSTIAYSALGQTTYVGESSRGMPYYFSGTNCRAKGWVSIGPPPEGWTGHYGLKSVKLFIGSGGSEELVRQYSVPQSGEPVAGGGISVMFDSTHFANGSSVTVRVEGRDSADRIYTASGSSPVKNYSVLYGRYDLEVWPLFWIETMPNVWGWFIPPIAEWTEHFSLPSAFSNLLLMGYGTNMNVTRGWSASNFTTAVDLANVVHLHSHMAIFPGNPPFAVSDSDQPDYWDIWDVYPAQNPFNHTLTTSNIFPIAVHPQAPLGSTAVLPARQAAIGSIQSPYSLPPYNESQKPPINLAFMDGCCASTINDFAEGFLYPYRNFYQPQWTDFPENQSCFGFNFNKDTNQSENVSSVLYKALRNGETIDQARILAFNAYLGSNKPDSPQEFMSVWGDFFTKIKGVYYGEDAAEDADPLAWYHY